MSKTMASGNFGPGPKNCLNCSLHRCVQSHLHKIAVRPAPLIGILQMMNLVDLGRMPHNTLCTFTLSSKWIHIFLHLFLPVQDKRNDDNDGHFFNAWDDIAHASVRVENLKIRPRFFFGHAHKAEHIEKTAFIKTMSQEVGGSLLDLQFFSFTWRLPIPELFRMIPPTFHPDLTEARLFLKRKANMDNPVQQFTVLTNVLHEASIVYDTPGPPNLTLVADLRK